MPLGIIVYYHVKLLSVDRVIAETKITCSRDQSFTISYSLEPYFRCQTYIPNRNTSQYETFPFSSSLTGTFSLLFVTFALKRHMGYFLINVYVPCSMLVILSWVGFWINREATADRIALGKTRT